MCIDKICSAPTNDGRCKNLTVNEKCDHCSVHHEEALRLYLEYKGICDVANAKNLETRFKTPQEQIKYLFSCHTWFVKAYNARLKHRLYAYVPEEYDNGHNIQFQIIQDKIDLCHSKIAECHDKIRKENELEWLKEDSEEDETPEESSHKETEDIIVKVKQFKKKQQDDDTHFDKIRRKNIKEQAQLLKEKTKAVNLCMNLIKSKLGFTNNSYFVEIAIFRTVVQMHNMDYFHPFYQPKPCSNCSCGGYEPIQFKLGCPCFLDKDTDSVSFLCRCEVATEHLKGICYDILRNPQKIHDMIGDFMECYKANDTGLLKRLMMFCWESDKDRLVLSYDGMPQRKKESEYMRQFRHKHRTMIKEYVQEKPKSPDKQWGDTLDDVCTFIDRNGKLPPDNSKKGRTQMFNKWLNEQMKDYEHRSGLMVKHEIHSSFEKFFIKYHQYFIK